MWRWIMVVCGGWMLKCRLAGDLKVVGSMSIFLSAE
jgi:hypothetical protein